MKEFIKKWWWIFGGGLTLWLCIAFGVYQANKTDFEEFNRTDIAGEITSLKTQNHGFAIAFELNDTYHYHFFPTKQQGGATGFMTTAAIGDSIQKKPWSDTLLLLKRGRILRYKIDHVLY
jgi:hypothetical protein